MEQDRTHKIPIPGSNGRGSAWFDITGKMLNAEILYPGKYAARAVKKDGPIWKGLERYGKIYLHKVEK